MLRNSYGQVAYSSWSCHLFWSCINVSVSINGVTNHSRYCFQFWDLILMEIRVSWRWCMKWRRWLEIWGFGTTKLFIVTIIASCIKKNMRKKFFSQCAKHLDSWLKKSKSIGHVSIKYLRHFSSIPRLKRLFLYCKISEEMSWHKNGKRSDTKKVDCVNGPGF